MKRIGLIEDNQLLLKRMASLIDAQEELRCVVAASSIGSFFEQLPEPGELDLILMDIELSENINSMDHLAKVKQLIPEAKVLIITGHNHPEYLGRALRNGANSFFIKGAGFPKLLEAIEYTLAGGAFLAPEAAVHILPFFNTDMPEASAGLSMSDKEAQKPQEALIQIQADMQLSQRERQVANGLVSGRSYKEIAEKFNISINTVRHYVKALYKKFHVSNKVQLSNKLKQHL